MNNIKKFTNHNGMWDGFAGCMQWPIIEGKENDGYREPVFVGIDEELLIIIDPQGAQIYNETDHLTLNYKFKTQAEAIEHLEMINPTKWEHFEILGFK